MGFSESASLLSATKQTEPFSGLRLAVATTAIGSALLLFASSVHKVEPWHGMQWGVKQQSLMDATKLADEPSAAPLPPVTPPWLEETAKDVFVPPLCSDAVSDMILAKDASCYAAMNTHAAGDAYTLTSIATLGKSTICGEVAKDVGGVSIDNDPTISGG